MVVHFRDDIPVSQACTFGGTTRIYIRDQGAFRLRKLESLGEIRCDGLNHYTQESSGDLTAMDDLIRDIAGHAAGNRETDALIAAGPAHDGGVYSNQTPVCTY